MTHQQPWPHHAPLQGFCLLTAPCPWFTPGPAWPCCYPVPIPSINMHAKENPAAQDLVLARSPDHPPVPGARHGAAWAPRGHRATRRRSTRHAGAMAPHTRTILPPPLLQLQQVSPSGLAWSSACGPAQCPNGVLGPHRPALHQ